MTSEKTASPTDLSWVESANEPQNDFPLQNLPYCAFISEREVVHLGVGIGNSVLDLFKAAETGLFDALPPSLRAACKQPCLNSLMSSGPGASALRSSLYQLFRKDGSGDRPDMVSPMLIDQKNIVFQKPVLVGNYTDFYASINHATNVGRLFRPDQPLLPNYKYVPIGYHGRASSIVVSGTPVVRPCGQIKLSADEAPAFLPTRQLDYELEVGAYVGCGNLLGKPIDIDVADGHIFGFTLLNDWSARDVQAWEYQPLGPFLGKNFMTSISPWVVTADALKPFATAVAERPSGDPAPLPYLASKNSEMAAYDVHLKVSLSSRRMREENQKPVLLSCANLGSLYWSFAQMLTHHTSNGCNLLPGDLIASGTVSGAAQGSEGSMLELTRRGATPLALPGGESRGFLEDGDEVIFQAYCERQGLPRIGFGECRGIVSPANVLYV